MSDSSKNYSSVSPLYRASPGTIIIFRSKLHRGFPTHNLSLDYNKKIKKESPLVLKQNISKVIFSQLINSFFLGFYLYLVF